MATLQKTIRVILVDDNEIIHKEISALFATWDHITLIAQGRNGEEAIELCEKHQPDIVLMDISMPLMNGVVATRAIISRQPYIKIIAMSGIDDTNIVHNMIQAGAAGYVLKESNPDELASTIRAVYDGKAVFSSKIMKPLLTAQNQRQDYGLTQRELQVLSLLAQGQTNAQIAHELGISQPTVRFHLNNVLEKLHVETRSEALVLAARQGII